MQRPSRAAPGGSWASKAQAGTGQQQQQQQQQQQEGRTSGLPQQEDRQAAHVYAPARPPVGPLSPPVAPLAAATRSWGRGSGGSGSSPHGHGSDGKGNGTSSDNSDKAPAAPGAWTAAGQAARAAAAPNPTAVESNPAAVAAVNPASALMRRVVMQCVKVGRARKLIKYERTRKHQTHLIWIGRVCEGRVPSCVFSSSFGHLFSSFFTCVVLFCLFCVC